VIKISKKDKDILSLISNIKSMSSFLDNIDDIDETIINILQENPQISYSKISRQVDLSQPAVAARILKLKRNGTLGFKCGINFKTADLPLMNLELICSDSEHVEKRAKYCPFIINVFNKIGKYNYQLLMTAPNLNLLNQITENCFRKDKHFQLISSSFMMNIEKDFILPINFDLKNIKDLKYCPCPFNKINPEFGFSKRDVELTSRELKEWQNLIEYISNQVNADLTFLSKIHDDRMEFIRVNESNQYIQEGTTIDLVGTFCEETIKNEKEYNMVTNAEKDEVWKDSKEVEDGWLSYLGFPVRWPDGRIFGTFCVAGRKKNNFKSSQIELLETCRNLIEVQLKLIYQNQKLINTSD